MARRGPQPAGRGVQGKERLFGGFFSGLAEHSGDTFTVDVDFIVADDEHAAAVVGHRATHGGRTLATRDVDAFNIRDGRIVEAWSTSFDPYESDEFWT